MTNDQIGDLLEQMIHSMFHAGQGHIPESCSYSMLMDSQASGRWHIALFFPDVPTLREHMESGLCYWMHQTIVQQLQEHEDTRELLTNISFETGERPESREAYTGLLQQLEDKLAKLNATQGMPPGANCDSCGHPFDEHQMMGQINEGEEAPTEGWMMCPEEDCTCFRTWSANYSGEAE